MGCFLNVGTTLWSFGFGFLAADVLGRIDGSISIGYSSTAHSDIFRYHTFGVFQRHLQCTNLLILR